MEPTSLELPANAPPTAKSMETAAVTTTACALCKLQLQRQLQLHLLAASTMVANVDLNLSRPANVTAVANATTIAVRTTGPSARLQRQLQRQLQRHLLPASTMVANVDSSLSRPANVTAVAN